MAGRADVMAGRAYVSLYAKRDLLTRGLQAARTELNTFGSDMMRMGAQIVATTAAIATPVAFATKTFADFDDAMRTVGAVSQSTAAELQSMTDVAKRLGATTSFTAIQVAQLMGELGRAGFKPDQVNAMTGAVMNLARATGTDATLASGIMAATVRQFALEAGDAARVADVLTHAANATFNSVESLGESLKYAGPVAAELGLSLEETAAILGTLGNVGIQGSEAGTALRRLGVISAATGEDLKKIFDINNVDMAGNLRPLVSIMDDIGKSIENLPTAEKVAKLNEAFGLLGITSASVLSRTAGSTADLANELRNVSGVADRTAKSMDAGLGGAFRIIWSAVEGLQIALGKALAGSLQTITNTITAVIGRASEWVGANEDLVTTISAVTTSVAALGVALVGVGIAAKASSGIVAAAGMAYKIAAFGAAAAWGAVSIAFSILTIKTRISAAIASTAWTVASSVIVAAWKTAGTLITAAMSTAILVASAAVITSAWVGAVAAISVAVFGLETVLATTAAIATAAWTSAGGAVTAVWVATSGAVATAWAASSATISALAGVAVGAWLSGAGLMGTATAVLGAAFTAAGGTGVLSATLVGAAWSASGAAASIAWSAFTAILGTVFTASNLLVFAAFAVKTAWAAAWLAVSGPILPLVIALGAVVAAIGAITAAATIATVRAMDFSKAWTIARDTLSSVIAIAKQVGGILMTALQQGDYDVAFKASMAGVKLVFATLVDSMGEMWTTFWDGAWQSVKTFMAEFAKLSSKVVVAVAKAIANPVTGQYELSQTISELTKDINLNFSIDTKGMASQAKAELDRLENELADRQAKRDAENKAKADAEAAAAGNAATLGASGEGQAFGDQSAAQMDGAAAAEEAKSAFDRETESIRQQIIALREGEDAAERFRLSKQGLTDAEIDQVMALRAEQEAITKEQENARRIVERIQDYADADYEKNKLTPAEIAAKEKAAIDLNLKQGRIDAKTAQEGMAEADIRQAEREHQERLKKLRGEGDAAFGSQSFGLKSGGASAATFSAQSLLSMGSGAGQGPQLKALLDTKKILEFQTKQQQELSEAQIAAIKNSKMKHA